MRLPDFILSHLEPILVEWEIFARRLGAGERLGGLALRDNAEQILRAAVRDMTADQTVAEQSAKSKGESAPTHTGEVLDDAADLHAADRLGLGFDMNEMMSEYRALRASVLRLWTASGPSASDHAVDDLTRFNESIDQAISLAVASYTRRIDQARDLFLTILSHDLRNPLSAIAMTGQAVPLVGGDPAEAAECGHRIARSVSVMERMIADLLDYTRTRLGAGMPVTPTAVDLVTLAQDVIDEYRAARPDRLIAFVTDGPLEGLWDYDRVRQAVSNVLGNAVQHGNAQAPITVALRGEPGNAFIDIHNAGDVIPPGELNRIFNPLVRGTDAADPRRNRPGSIGMGLYIAREVARSHGGRVDVVSTIDAGTTFTFRLPRASAPREGQPILDAKRIETM